MYINFIFKIVLFSSFLLLSFSFVKNIVNILVFWKLLNANWPDQPLWTVTWCKNFNRKNYKCYCGRFLLLIVKQKFFPQKYKKRGLYETPPRWQSLGTYLLLILLALASFTCTWVPGRGFTIYYFLNNYLWIIFSQFSYMPNFHICLFKHSLKCTSPTWVRFGDLSTQGGLLASLGCNF